MSSEEDKSKRTIQMEKMEENQKIQSEFQRCVQECGSQIEQQPEVFLRSPTLWDKCVAEFIGTMFIICFGVGSVNAAVLTGANQGLWQVAVVWGLAVCFGIICTADVSGAHLNPAVSFALVLFRGFDPVECLFYMASQMLAGVIGGLINYFIFMGSYKYYDDNGDYSGDLCVHKAMVFGEYFPNPGHHAGEKWLEAKDTVSLGGAFAIEAWGTMVLMFVICAVTDKNNRFMNKANAMIPWVIGFTVSMLITVYAPLTQAGWNPARDFGPRLAGLMIGLGSCAIPGPRNGFWIYILGPMVGAPIGALLYDNSIGKGLPIEKESLDGRCQVFYCRIVEQKGEDETENEGKE